MHLPALLDEVLELINPRAGGLYLDGTLGYGGYSKALLDESAPSGIVYGFDIDKSAVERAAVRLLEYGSRFVPRHAGYHDAAQELLGLGISKVDGITLDLGLSSIQLDDPFRGFSFRFDGPLDMRFDTDSGQPLSELLKKTTASKLENVLREFGDERFSSRISKAIIGAARKGTLKTTKDLAELVARMIPGRRGRIHPATRTFQALRIMVNEELDNLKRALEELPPLLNPGARLCVVSYHSLEDRMVKVSFKQRVTGSSQWRIVTPKPVRPSLEESRNNPRARSARLRSIESVA